MSHVNTFTWKIKKIDVTDEWCKSVAFSTVEESVGTRQEEATE